MAAERLLHSPAVADVARTAAPGVAPTHRADGLDLDTRISVVEQQLIAREQRLLSQVQGLGRRASEAVAPRALLVKAGGVVLGGAGLVWALRRAGRRGAVAGSAAGARIPAAAQSNGPPQLLLSLLPMAWPLLPARWRTRVSPATAATVLGVAVPLLRQALARRSPASRDDAARPDPAAPPTVANLDLLRFAGTWHEQARLPTRFEQACGGQPRATYTPQASRPGRLAVHNECSSANGRLQVADGVARVVPGSGGARLQVSFMPAWLQWLPMAWSDLWLLHVDEEASDYRVALAGDPSRRSLWLLSRSPQLPAEALQRLIAVASNLGYDTSRLVPAGPPATLH